MIVSTKPSYVVSQVQISAVRMIFPHTFTRSELLPPRWLRTIMTVVTIARRSDHAPEALATTIPAR
jgi:hypothetical protein